MRRLPPLAAVRAFEAAGRHENFTAAAVELGMTQAAVSYQIKLLEERLGLPLFHRERRRVRLSEAGRRAIERVSAAFDSIDAAFGQARAEDEAVLTVSTTQTFATVWLAWRIGSFQVAHPEIAVRIVASDALADFAADEVDIAIRSGLGSWPGVVADRIAAPDFTPMCSAAFLAARGGRLAPEDLLRLPLISPQDPWWAIWLGDAGVSVPDSGLRPGVRLDNQAMDGNAAIAGQGLAILSTFLWRQELRAGRLVQPFAQASTSGDGYWFVVPEARRGRLKVRRFREWLLAEVARDPPG